MSEEFQAGKVLPGTPYRVLSLIGRGGMGSVYEVEHAELGKRFVLKALLRELTSRSDLAMRLRNEWRSLGQLEHRNIVTVTDAGLTDNGVPYYVMERLAGEHLGSLMRRQGRLPVEQSLRIAADVLEGLGAAHRIGVVHRDVKPPNIFIVRGGPTKLLDFGIAKILNRKPDNLTGRGVAIGTPRYMSPEQAEGKVIDGRADLYALGLVLYEMLAGESPFEGADANEIFIAHLTRRPPRLSSRLPSIPGEIDEMVARLLEKDPRRRPSSAGVVAGVLRQVWQSRHPGHVLEPWGGRGADEVASLTGQIVQRPLSETEVSAHGVAAGPRFLPSRSDTQASGMLSPPAGMDFPVATPAVVSPPPISSGTPVVLEAAPHFGGQHTPPPVSSAPNGSPLPDYSRGPWQGRRALLVSAITGVAIGGLGIVLLFTVNPPSGASSTQQAAGWEQDTDRADDVQWRAAEQQPVSSGSSVVASEGATSTPSDFVPTGSAPEKRAASPRRTPDAIQRRPSPRNGDEVPAGRTDPNQGFGDGRRRAESVASQTGVDGPSPTQSGVFRGPAPNRGDSTPRTPEDQSRRRKLPSSGL